MLLYRPAVVLGVVDRGFASRVRSGRRTGERGSIRSNANEGPETSRTFSPPNPFVIAASVDFQRRSTHRRAVHYVNHELRRWGLAPQPFGQESGIDTFKSYFEWPVRVKRKLAHLLGIES